jgi:hypothetical protein
MLIPTANTIAWFSWNIELIYSGIQGLFGYFSLVIFFLVLDKGIIYGKNEFPKPCEYKRIKVVVHLSCEMPIDSDTFFTRVYHCIFGGGEIVHVIHYRGILLNES